MIGDAFLLSVRTLRQRGLRTVLTTMGIFVGIAAVVALLSLGQGLQEAITSQFEKIGTDKLIIQKKGSFGTGESAAANLSRNDLEKLQSVRGVKGAAGHITRAAIVSLRDEKLPVLLGSLPPEQDDRDLVIEVHTLNVEKGRWLRPSEKLKAVIGNDFARKEVLSRKVQTGDKLSIQGAEFEVVGVLEQVGAPDADNAIFIDEDDLRSILNLSRDEFDVLIVRIVAGEDIRRVQASVERALRREHGQKEGEEDFDVESPEDLLKTFNTILNIVQAVLAGIAAISLVVGGIGIMNTMYTSVLERYRDIGIMKATGATNRQVLLIFLAESAVLGFVGGVIGLLLGLGTSKAVELIAAQVLGGMLIRAAMPVWVIVGALVFAMTVGIISGIAPAYQAAKLAPVEALQHD